MLLGIGSEICARVMEHETFFHLDAPVIRVTGMLNAQPLTSYELIILILSCAFYHFHCRCGCTNAICCFIGSCRPPTNKRHSTGR